MNKEWIVFSTAGRWQTQGILKAKSLGFSILSIDGDPNAEGFEFSDKVICCDLKEHIEIISQIESLNITPRGVISYCSEAGMPLAASIRERFNLPGLDKEQTLWFTNKKFQREIWKKNDIPGPIFDIFSSLDDATNFLKTLTTIKIIKPTDSAGSRGVSILNKQNSSSSNNISDAFKHSKSNEVIIEDYITGQELTVESFSSNGKCQILCITEKKKITKTGGVVAYELHTTLHKSEIVSKIKLVVTKALKALKYNDGPAHTEVILEDNGDVKLVETAARGGGFNLFDKFIPAASGVNVPELTILQAANKPLPNYKTNLQHAILRFIPSQEGKVLEINGIEEVRKELHIDCEKFVNIGDNVNEATSDGDRLAFILAKGIDFNSINQIVDKAENMIEFKIG